MENERKSSQSPPKLGILLTTGPENQDVNTVIKLAEAALSSGNSVEIFLMCDGVHNIVREDVKRLQRKGAILTVCAHNAGQRGLKKISEVIWGSQFDLARSVHGCDAFLAFN